MRKVTMYSFVALSAFAVLVGLVLLQRTGAGANATAAATGPALGAEADPMALSISDLDVSEGKDASRLAQRPAQAANAFIPADPPTATLITIGQADIDGMAVISGAAGAVDPGTPVYVAGLDTGMITSTMSGGDGSFQTTFFAPPGAWIQVKHGGEGLRDPPIEGGEADVSWLNVLPGTIVRASIPAAPEGDLPFALAGSFNAEGGTTEWMVQGYVVTQTVGSDTRLVVSGTVRATAATFTSGTTISNEHVFGSLRLVRFFDQHGRRVPVNGVFASTFKTPTGLPISREVMRVSPIDGPVTVTDWTYAGGHTMAGVLSATLDIPASTPSGHYRPRLWLVEKGIPMGPGRFYTRMGVNLGHYLPMVRVGDPQPPRLTWVALNNTFSNATRGTVAHQDKERFGLQPHIITQADVFIIPRLDARTGEPIVYRLEPFLPMVSMADRSIPGQPQIPFQLPSGSLEVQVAHPDGSVVSLGPRQFQQSTSRSPSNREGKVYDIGGGRIDDMYQLTTLDDSFGYTFEQYGHHVITMTGTVEDIWGNVYQGEGTFDVHVARALKLDPGQLPTTPYVVGDAFSPGLQVYPPVPAGVQIRLLHLTNSNPVSATEHTVTGTANAFGYFQPPVGTAITMATPGEFRVDVLAVYDAGDGTLWMGSATWGNVVEGPVPSIVAHGRRGRDLVGPWNLQWFFHDDLPKVNALHSMYPYWSGDVLWGRSTDNLDGGDAIIPAVTIQDVGGGGIESFIQDRWNNKVHSSLAEGLSFTMRVANAELPLFSTTSDGNDLFWSPDLIDHYGYAYRTSERPGVRLHETISEDALGIAYWRFDAEFGGQAGFEGDLPHDLKWEFGGAVFRVLSETNPINEYAVYGSLWVLVPDSDPLGARVTAPFSGTTGALPGGPILTLKGQDVHLFFMPKGVQPGDVLEMGDSFSFAGHVGPPLNSHVTVTVTDPDGVVAQTFDGYANKIGWFYDPSTDLFVDKPGVWTVHVHVEQDSSIPSGGTPAGNNTGGVLGSADGRYHFYVVEPGSARLGVTSPQPGYLSWPMGGISGEPITVTTVPITVPIPAGLANAVVSYTIRMPGFILEEGTLTPAGSTFTIVYDPLALHQDFPNLDLKAKDASVPGLTDPVLITFLLSGEQGGQRVHRAGTVFLDGDEVHTLALTPDQRVYLPVVLRDHAGEP
jgi:hypothetical protein